MTSLVKNQGGCSMLWNLIVFQPPSCKVENRFSFSFLRVENRFLKLRKYYSRNSMHHVPFIYNIENRYSLEIYSENKTYFDMADNKRDHAHQSVKVYYCTLFVLLASHWTPWVNQQISHVHVAVNQPSGHQSLCDFHLYQKKKFHSVLVAASPANQQYYFLTLN